MELVSTGEHDNCFRIIEYLAFYRLLFNLTDVPMNDESSYPW